MTSLDKKAIVWNALTGDELFRLSSHGEAIESAAFSPDARRVATPSTDGMLKVWDLTPSREVLTLFHPVGATSWFDLSPDGGCLLMTGESAALPEVWQIPQRIDLAGQAAKAKRLQTLAGHTEEVRGLSFSPDGTMLATASRDGTAKLWDASSGQELLALSGSGVGLCCIVFSPDGTHLFTGGDDGVRVYVLRIEDLVKLARNTFAYHRRMQEIFTC